MSYLFFYAIVLSFIRVKTDSIPFFSLERTIKMMNTSIAATWRGAANEPDAHEDQFPTAFQLIREPLDHANKQILAKNIVITFDICDVYTFVRVFNDGDGVTPEGEMRFMSWGCPSSANGTNMYGQGTKKAWAKGCPKYEDSTAFMEHRRVGSEAGVRFESPYMGLNTARTPLVSIPVGVTNGWNILNSRLADIVETPAKLITAAERLVRSRYPQSSFDTKKWTIIVKKNGVEMIRSSSEVWRSLKEDVRAHSTWNTEIQIGTTRVSSFYLPTELPNSMWGSYGKIGGQNAKNCFVSLSTDDVGIEITHYSDIFNRIGHNEWGKHWKFFVNFIGTSAPVPCTTKVQYDRTSDEWKAFRDQINAVDVQQQLHPWNKQPDEPSSDQGSVVSDDTENTEALPKETWFVKNGWARKGYVVEERDDGMTVLTPRSFPRTFEDHICGMKLFAGFVVPCYAESNGLLMNRITVVWKSTHDLERTRTDMLDYFPFAVCFVFET